MSKNETREVMLRAMLKVRDSKIQWKRCKCGVSHNEKRCPFCGK
jgi:hypothetical protein